MSHQNGKRMAAVAGCLVMLLSSGCIGWRQYYQNPAIGPLGTLSDPVWQMQELNAEHADFIVNVSDFQPHGARLNTAGEDHVKQVAADHGLTTRESSVGNVVVAVPATAGHEEAPLTVLQAHLDMVCEQNADTSVDFEKEPIDALIAEDVNGNKIVRAKDTTLGADNGIGVAMALAAATEPSVIHGPLELLFTVDEEDGMTGAKATM